MFHAAAKDTRINPACRVNGVLDDRFRRLRPDEDRVNIGGDHYVNEWPENSSWDFVAVGRSHDLALWTSFLAALHRVGPDMAVNIEHEDVEFGRIEGLGVAADTLTKAAAELT